MKIKFVSFLLFLAAIFTLSAQNSVFVYEPQIPILIDRTDNVLMYVRLVANDVKTLNTIDLSFGKEVNLKEIRSVRLFYSGTEADQRKDGVYYAPVGLISGNSGKGLAAEPSYSILRDEHKNPSGNIRFNANQNLFPGINYFWISIQMKPKTSLFSNISAKVTAITADNKSLDFELKSQSHTRRMGVGVRRGGDDGVAAFRIPGLVTTNAGTLLGVYDARYNSSVDLQEHVDIGLSRSTNGGKTWEKMRIPMAFGQYEGLPKGQNGVGDPSILVDKQTGTIWIVAAWTHGMGNRRAWFNSLPGMTIHETAQLMMVRSDDDGKTWSAPINVTSQVKDPSWRFLLQGPGRGISMNDGTLVFPTQYIDPQGLPHAGIMCSKDHGNTWTISAPARDNTTEAQVAEVTPGVLMLNMRDNRGGSRAVSITSDYGKTWTEHPSNRSALQEPVCMASLIKVEAIDNITGKDLLLFSNPNTTKDRKNMTIKASFDGGLTWKESNQLLLDEDYGWGYSCLTMIDKETVGILYESSVAHMTFQAVKLKDIIEK
ncbi:MAG TPA: exo-alpha-sialidase [Paludibacteraceae bacterium]|jgi:sialidase-1|nr:exo-alpha-sialidase [Paludibacteraceae bacterium]